MLLQDVKEFNRGFRFPISLDRLEIIVLQALSTLLTFFFEFCSYSFCSIWFIHWDISTMVNHYQELIMLHPKIFKLKSSNFGVSVLIVTMQGT
jgi:hypothetical protein